MIKRESINRALYSVALDLPIYREFFSKGVAFLGALFGFQQMGVELYLRGLTYRKLSDGKKIHVGRFVVFVGRDRIKLGENVCLYGFDYLNAEGDQGYIKIGERSHIDQFCVLYGQGGLEIGKFSAIASGVKIYSQSNQYKYNLNQKIIDQPVVYKKVIIGDDVWVGANAVILPGVRIEEGAIVGACSLVKDDVPTYAIVGGIPAKIVGWRKTEKVESVR